MGGKRLKDLNTGDVKWLNAMSYVMPVAALLMLVVVHFSGAIEGAGLFGFVFKGVCAWVAIAGFFAFKFLAKTAAAKGVK